MAPGNRYPVTDGGFGMCAFVANETCLDCWLEDATGVDGAGNTGGAGGTCPVTGDCLARSQTGEGITDMQVIMGDRLTPRSATDAL